MIFESSSVADNIKQYRKKNNLTQAQMADKLNMHRQNYSQLERGLYSPSLKKILEICSVLNITPNDLFLDEKENEEIDALNIDSFTLGQRINYYRGQREFREEMKRCQKLLDSTCEDLKVSLACIEEMLKK